MSELKNLETLLHSWKPRLPSSRLRSRLFGRQSRERAEAGPDYVPFRLGWLAPATTALLLACVLLNQHSGNALEGPVVAGPLVAAAISNQQAASWLPGSFARAQNSPPVRSFEWTNDRASVSSISSLSGARGTN